jgi:manganese transport protein
MKTETGLLKRIGPGLITAAVVLGPGSIVASSRAGAESAYGLVWVLASSCIFMAVFTAMGARLGCALEETPITWLARRWGRPLAVITGFSAFFVTAGFQFGNNLGVSAALAGIFGERTLPLWPVIFTSLSIIFLFAAKHLYRILEKVMIGLVAAMLTAFLLNLVFAGVRPFAFLGGFVPRRLSETEMLIAPAMLATTFSAVAAFYQAWLVRNKGWKRENIRTAITDAWIGIAILGTLALIIMMSAAGALHGTGAQFGNVGELAKQLQGVAGGWAVLIFCLGLAAASFSSFIANALIGGVMMADGLGQKADIGGWPVRLWTSAVLLIGCGVTLGARFISAEVASTSVLIAQASTLLAAPISALLLYFMSSSRALMGDLRNRRPAMILGAIGLILLLAMTVNTLLKLIERFSAAG